MKLSSFNRLKKIFFCLLVLNCYLGNAYSGQSQKPISCQQEYALCTSAACVPDPRHPRYALCTCVVKKDISLGFTSCDKREPKINKYKIKRIRSSFSFAQFDQKKGMMCPEGSPWTDCLDSPCTVSPRNPSQAICSCKIHHKKPFFTLGGDCNTSSCATGYWSGTTKANSTLLRNTLLEKLNMNKDPWPYAACPSTTTKN
ncbi:MULTISPECIES: hypothetical protein [Legionella]|uniref:Secreted protein n=1 Tax=Legionella donaldsonii TaxID=45060 RepID=A0A378J7R0_9GAMM|nr:hypothetical protein [Legionella donaldsonii]STX43782.1 Uncharacterised protein [Legionella donaldsonii]